MHDDKLNAERRRYEEAANDYAANIRDAQKNATALKKANARLAKANRQITELKAELALLGSRQGWDGGVARTQKRQEMRPTMSKLLLIIGALAVASVTLPAALEHQPATEVEWRWSDDKAKLAYSIKQHLPDYDVEPVRKDEFYTPINIRTKDGKRLVYHLEKGHQAIVFTRSKNTLFVAEFWAIATGCKVAAIDLATGKELWKSTLEGIGPTGHSKYSNRVNIETDGKKIIVYGNESHGKYVEHLDINTGKMLLNKKFEPMRK